MEEKKEVYFVAEDGEENFYAGDNLPDVMEFIETYVAEMVVDDELDLVITKKEMTQAEIDALPEY